MDEKDIEMYDEAIEDTVNQGEDEGEDWDEKRRKERERQLAPYREAAAQRKESAKIISEHDELLADMLFEMTLNELSDL